MKVILRTRFALCAPWISSALFLAGTLVAFAQTNPSAGAAAQAPTSQTTLEVKSNLVLVPVFVYDTSQMERAPKEELPCARATVAEFLKLATTQPYLPTDCDITEVRDLAPKDFRLFQDGALQPIVKMDAGAWWTLVRDNFGWHMQASDAPRGIWSLSELGGIKRVPVINRDFHILAYVPPSSTSGCHSIRVEVDRPKLLVFARNQYCAGQTPSDPLYGTGEGNKLEHDLSSGKAGKIPVSLHATAFSSGENNSRVDVSLEFPWNDLYRKWDTANWTLYARIGVMGVVRRKDGSVAARFSDLLYPPYWPTFDQGGTKFIEWQTGTSKLSGGIPHMVNGSVGNLGSSDSSYGNDTLALTFPNAAGEIAPDTTVIQTALDSSDPFWIPTRYQTQIDVPPGEYTLEVALNDGWNVGRAEMPLTVESSDGHQLALSSIALCKRLRDAHVASEEDTRANFAPQYIPMVSKGIEFTPAADTRFEKGEPMFAYFEVYDPSLTKNSSTSVQIQMNILDAGTGKVAGVLAPVSAAPYVEPGRSTLSIARTIPASQLPKGTYTLQVRATDSSGASTPWRTVNFTKE